MNGIVFASGNQHSAASAYDLPSSQLLISSSEEKYQGRYQTNCCQIFLGTVRN